MGDDSGTTDSGTTGTNRLDTSVSSAKRLSVGVLVLLSVLTGVIGGLRFARADVAGTSFFANDEYYTYTTDDGKFVDHLNIDIVSYLAMTENDRGVENPFYKMQPYESFERSGGLLLGPVAPFINRPALPFIASLLPLDAADSFALVNLVLVMAGVWFLVDALAVQGRSTRAQLIGGLLYAVALPVLVFASSLYIDGGAMAVFVMGYWLVARRWWWAFAIFLPLSYTVKEAIIFLAPSAIVAWKASGRSFRDSAFLIGAPVVAVAWFAVAVLVRIGAPTPTFSFSLGPKLSYIGGNLIAVTSTAFFIVGMGAVMVPALLCIYRFVRLDGWSGAFDRAGPEIIGVAMFALVNLYSVASTDLTLRTGWLFYPFAISLAALLVDDLAETATPWRRVLSAPAS